jgi:RNA polymerase sigma factor (TIGR02999 family)
MFGLMGEITRILSAAAQGEPHAAAQLLPLVYNELRKLAAEKMAQERPGQTLQATALVHEAYLRLVLVDGEKGQHWDGRGHFFAAAAEAMRRILVEAARRKGRLKHGGGCSRESIESVFLASPQRPQSLLDLDEALDRLARVQPQAAELVKLRYFAGLSNADAASCLGISPRRANQVWAYARAWLLEDLTSER